MPTKPKVRKELEQFRAEEKKKKTDVKTELQEARRQEDIRATFPKKEPIEAEKEKTGIAAVAEREDIVGQATRVLTSPKTTLALGGVLAALATGGIAGGALRGAGAAKATGQIIGKEGVPISRAFIGKSASGGLSKVSGTTRGILSRFPMNSKSIGLTSSFLGKTIVNPATLLAAIGSYPFAGFIKEEALQTLSFGFRTAEFNKDIPGMEAALEEQRDLLNPTAWQTIFNSVPFVNILNQLKNFYEAALTKLEIDETRLNTLREETEGGE